MWCIFCPLSMFSTVQSQIFGNFMVPAHTWSHYTMITYKLQYLWRIKNFADTGSRILLHWVSSSHGVIPSRKFTLNFNGEVNYRELALYCICYCKILWWLDEINHWTIARRPWLGHQVQICGAISVLLQADCNGSDNELSEQSYVQSRSMRDRPVRHFACCYSLGFWAKFQIQYKMSTTDTYHEGRAHEFYGQFKFSAQGQVYKLLALACLTSFPELKVAW